MSDQRPLKVETTEAEDGLDAFRTLMVEFDNPGQPAEGATSGLSEETRQFTFVDTEGRSGSSVAGKTCYFAVLDSSEGMERCKSRLTTKVGKPLKFCWLRSSDCNTKGHLVSGKEEPVWGDLYLMTNGGKTVLTDHHISPEQLLPIDVLEDVLRMKGSEKELIQWLNVRRGAGTPTSSKKSSSWTEGDMVSKDSLADLDLVEGEKTKSTDGKLATAEGETRTACLLGWHIPPRWRYSSWLARHGPR